MKVSNVSNLLMSLSTSTFQTISITKINELGTIMILWMIRGYLIAMQCRVVRQTVRVFQAITTKSTYFRQHVQGTKKPALIRFICP